MVGCRWIFIVKLKPDGSIDRYKARLVAKRYTQKYGIDSQETFAPVAKINTIRILMALAAQLNWPLRQYDVKNAFWNGDLEEEVYMDPPPGIQCKPSDVEKVCKLRKALYGLKQSPKAWFGRFTNLMRRSGYKQSNSDHTLFIKRRHKGVIEMESLQKRLASEFEMKDLGQLRYFLGMEVAYSDLGISLS